MNLLNGLEEITTENELLSKYVWFRIGGPAKYFVRPKNEEQLKTVITRCRENNCPWYILGNGANLLIDDNGLDAVVIKLDNGFSDVTVEDNNVTAGAACSLGSVMRETIKQGLAGMEELVGIPGTIGGTVKSNAGGKFTDIGTVISKIWVIDASGASFTREKPELVFEYRKTNIHNQIVTKAQFDLIPDDPQRLINRMRETFIIKKNSQPLSFQSAGCIFKNPPGEKPAGMLIDKAGLKGEQIGGAMISEHHANFIINKEHATFDDVSKLIALVKDRVYEKFNVELETEIEIWKN